VILSLEIDSTDRVHMVGIHGIDGIGKTELALALALYNLITDNFKGVCFLENMREILHKIWERIQIIGVKEGISQIQRRLSRIKVLLVLDDVDEHEQWIAIAEKSDWFHLVSRIIITTQDKYLPTPHDNERTYKIQGLNKEGSLYLLYWKAFKTDIVNQRYENILTCGVNNLCFWTSIGFG
ncbi:hypothetical protein S83_016543, partial [Arachis hypogaea]